MASKGSVSAAGAAAAGATTRIEIQYVKGTNQTGNFFGYIEISNDELKDGNGDKWVEGTQWVDIETLLSKIEHPACFVFCRTNKQIIDKEFEFRTHGFPYPLMTPIKATGQYLYFEAHGKYTGKKFLFLKDFFKGMNNFVFRAPPGRKCSQLGVKHCYLPYDYFMSCFMSGWPIDTKPTNDLLQVKTMKIMLRDYTYEKCDERFLERSQTLKGCHSISPLGNAGRKNATAGSKRSTEELSSIAENENTQRLTPIEENENTELLTPNKVSPEPAAKHQKTGGSIRKTVKKRKQKRKTKTRIRKCKP